ncbi:hypothetical protein C4D60_Mb08t12760 [Musa balbisiana]|uniref:Uncharacterized protein n=1 Tax=Musa balbisiana TaxID=52838 RepID=A0A4S8K3F7_MUSBA|nr:hypothetical protein C4D60_Mb08t12760 [Musa balbisiana]
MRNRHVFCAVRFEIVATLELTHLLPHWAKRSSLAPTLHLIDRLSTKDKNKIKAKLGTGDGQKGKPNSSRREGFAMGNGQNNTLVMHWYYDIRKRCEGSLCYDFSSSAFTRHLAVHPNAWIEQHHSHTKQL